MTSSGKDRLDKLQTAFRDDIARIAETCVKHEGGTQIEVRHINAAFEVLGRLAFNRQPWWKRPELVVGLGVGIVSLALQLPGYAGNLLGSLSAPYVLAVTVFSWLLIFFGVGIVVFGWVYARYLH